MNQELTNFKIIIKQTQNTIRIFRLYNTRGPILLFLLSLKVTRQPLLSSTSIGCIAIIICIYGIASILNYISDQDLDSSNNRPNPIIYPKKIYYTVCLILFFVSLIIIAALPNWKPNILFATTAVILAIVYSLKPLQLSRNAYMKFLIMAVAYAYLPVLFGINFIDVKISWEQIQFLLITATIYTAYLPYSDIKDISGDLKHKKKTLANIFGVKRVSIVCTIIVCLSAILFLTQTPHFLTTSPVSSFFLTIVTIMYIYSSWNNRLLHNRNFNIALGTILYLFLFSLLV